MNALLSGPRAASTDESMSRASELYEQGRRAEQAGKFQEALKFYRNAARADANFRPAFNNLGALYARAKRPDLAIGFFRRALELGEDEAVYFNLGSECYRMEEYAESEAYLKKSLKQNPRFLKSHLLLAYLHGELGRNEKAEIYFKNALKLDANNRMAALGLAVSLAGREQHEASLKVVNRFLEKFKGDQALQNLRAGLLIKLNRYQESLADLSQLTQTSKKYTSFTDHLKAARTESGAEMNRLFEGINDRISDRTHRLKARLEKRKALLQQKKSGAEVPAAGEDPELKEDLQEMVDLSFLHLFNGDPEKAMRYLVQARKIKTLSE